MRLRLLACLPIAALIVALMLGAASPLVVAFERSQDESVPRPFVVSRYETACDALRREIHALSHRVSRCELAPECRGSPLLCPVALDAGIQLDYERLRDALERQCGVPRGLVDFAWESGEQLEHAGGCGISHDGFEAAARGESRPRSYAF